MRRNIDVPTFDGLAETIGAVHEAGGLVVGSLGRAVVLSSLGLSPTAEFDARHQEVLRHPDGTWRDVDVVGPQHIDRELAGLPHLVDGTSCFNSTRRLYSRGGNWWYSDMRGSVQQLDERCFEPLEGEIFGIVVRAVRPATHMALRYARRPSVGHEILEEHLPPAERALLASGIYSPLLVRRPRAVVDSGRPRLREGR